MLSEEKWLGKISRCTFGAGGYNDAMFGVSFTFTGKYGISDFWGWWKSHDARCKWQPEDWDRILADSCRKLKKIMADAKVSDIRELVDIPVEVTTKDNRLESWRVLTEVI